MSQKMTALSRTSGLTVAGWRHQRGVPGRSIVSRAPLQLHDKTLKAGQSARRHKMPIQGLSGTAAQAQIGAKAAAPKQLPELPTLDGKQDTRMHVQPAAHGTQHVVNPA